VVAVALVTAYNEKHELLLGRRKDNKRWTLPGGHLEEGEDAREGAIRELLEETGLTPKSLSFVTKYTTSAAVELNVYSAYVSGEPHSHLDPDDEVSEWRFVDVSKGMPSKIDAKLHGPEDDTNILRRIFDLGKSELLSHSRAQDVYSERLGKADTRLKDGDVYKTFRFPDEESAEEFSRRCRDKYEDDWKGIGVHHRDGVRVVVRAWNESNMDDYQHTAKKFFGGKVIDADDLDQFVSPEYRRSLAKAEHEVARLLAHPNPVERLMALRLNSVGPDHIRSAMLDADPKVHEAAIAHPMFDSVDGMTLAQASADTAGNYPLANQLAFLRSPHVQPEHLGELISRSPTLPPAVQQQLFDGIIKHPALAPDDISRLYSDYGTTGAQRLALLDHPNTPDPVLQQAIRLGVEVPGDAQPFSMRAAAHPNLSPEFRSAFVRRIPVSAPEHLLALGCHLLRSGPVSPELARDLQVQRSLKGAPFDRLLGAYLQGPSATADDVAQAIESGNPLLLQGAAQSRALLPHQLDGIVAHVKASGDQGALTGLMDHRFFGNRHLQMLLAKRENLGSVDQAMVGHSFAATPEFLAAKFLSGLPEVPESSARQAYFRAEQDIGAAALMAYGFEVTNETLSSLKGALGLGLAPAEVLEEKIPLADVIATFCSGADVAEAVKRAGDAGKIVHVRNGVMRADDPKGKSWFLRRAGAGYLPESDAAWYQIVKAWGLEGNYPRTELLTVNAVPYVATIQVPSVYKTLGYLASKDPNAARKQLGQYLATGQVHIWAAVDAILGNRDANEWSVLVEDRASERPYERSTYAASASVRIEPRPEFPGVFFIDHGNAFSATAPLPDSDAFVPFILTVFTDQAEFGGLSLEKRLERLPRVDAGAADVIKKWLLSLDANALNGAPNGDACATRLARLRELAAAYPADDAINRFFCFAQGVDPAPLC